MKRQKRYVIYKCNEDKTVIQVEKVGEREETWDDMKNSIGKESSR